MTLINTLFVFGLDLGFSIIDIKSVKVKVAIILLSHYRFTLCVRPHMNLVNK